MASIRSEVRILSSLDHECATRLLPPEFLETEDYLIIAMEFAEGGELDKQASRGEYSAKTRHDILTF